MINPFELSQERCLELLAEFEKEQQLQQSWVDRCLAEDAPRMKAGEFCVWASREEATPMTDEELMNVMATFRNLERRLAGPYSANIEE